ncbi:MAG: 4Fe-4S dicluster domain-containing protein [bacterium]
MKWTSQAEEAVSKIPFFIRKRVRKRVEEEALRSGAQEVNLCHVQTCQKRFIDSMEQEVRGYRIETCFGSAGCPNQAVPGSGLVQSLEACLSARNLRDFLKNHVTGPLKMHHDFVVSVSDCPNACSRPQIVDIGLIGASRVKISDKPCSQCGACGNVCKEQAVSLSPGMDAPLIDPNRCLSCGQCLKVCPAGTLQQADTGYRILIGGKLGRHPRLGTELPGIYSREEVLKIVNQCLDFYLLHNKEGERLGETIKRAEDMDFFPRLIGEKQPAVLASGFR